MDKVKPFSTYKTENLFYGGIIYLSVYFLFWKALLKNKERYTLKHNSKPYFRPKSNGKRPIKKMSLEECRKYLRKNNREYSDEQIIQIRDLLYQWAQIDYEVFLQEEKKERVAQEDYT